MNNSDCKKVISMLSMYIENKLGEDERKFIENHFSKCRSCCQKYLEMKDIMKNLHFEYEKLLSEFERIENNKIFNIREYQTFHDNISPYIDDELCYDDSIKFRKYLLKSKPARKELACAYGLRNKIRNSVTDYKNKLNFNYSKQIIKKLKSGNKLRREERYLSSTIFLGIMIVFFVFVSVFLLYTYFNASYAKEIENEVNIENVACEFDNDDIITFYFDENNEAILLEK